jgi:hypothetical protein
MPGGAQAASVPLTSCSPDEGTARQRASYGRENLSRLVALKDRYDPSNTFSLNANIPASAHAG